jgi:hypothetical protein
MRRAILVSVLVTTVLIPASARAATAPSVAPPPVATTPAVPTAPAPAAPVQTQLALQFDRVGGALATALTGASVVVRGTTDAFAPDQTVVVRFYLSGHKLAARRVSLLPQAGGGGAFALSFKSPRPGAFVVLATHDATPALAGFATRTRSIDVIPRRVTPRSGRASIRALQRRLRRLGYVTGAPGVYDERTGRAVLAFRKVAGLDRNANASTNVMRAIARGAGRFVVAHPEQGRHVEADLSRQVLALIERGRAVAIYPISSGKPSTPTVLGSYRVYTKTPGTNHKGMVDSSYFFRGYAIHGYFSVPTYAASHGCLRIPVPDAATVFNWVTVGTPVDVYR